MLSNVVITRFSASCFLAFLFCGCAHHLGKCKDQFTHLRASNYRDEVIAEWTARGRIVPLERGGFRITAVERISGPPMRHYTRYPDGWVTTVQGAHIWKWECAKPAWLEEMEADSVHAASISK